jgi:hypothetical protein
VVRGVTIVGMLLVNNTGDPAATPTELSHSPWHGLTVADLVFPLFPFAVGVAMPMSRSAGSLRQVLRRCALLFVVGSLLVSAKHRHRGPVDRGPAAHRGCLPAVLGRCVRLPRRAGTPARRLSAHARARRSPRRLRPLRGRTTCRPAW